MPPPPQILPFISRLNSTFLYTPDIHSDSNVLKVTVDLHVCNWEQHLSPPCGSNAIPSQYVAKFNIQIRNSPIEQCTAGIIVLNRPQGLPVPNSWRYIEMIIDSVIKPYYRRCSPWSNGKLFSTPLVRAIVLNIFIGWHMLKSTSDFS